MEWPGKEDYQRCDLCRSERVREKVMESKKEQESTVHFFFLAVSCSFFCLAGCLVC